MTSQNIIDFPQTFWICDPEHPEMFHWRECKFRIKSTADYTDLVVFIKEDSAGRDIYHRLYQSKGFQAAIDHAFESIVGYHLDMYHLKTPILETRTNEWRRFPVMNCSSRSFRNAKPEVTSSSLEFSLPEEYHQDISRLSESNIFHLHKEANRVAAELERKRQKTHQPYFSPAEQADLRKEMRENNAAISAMLDRSDVGSEHD